MNGKKCIDRLPDMNEDDDFDLTNDVNQPRKSSIGDYMNLTKPSAVFVQQQQQQQSAEISAPEVSHIDLNYDEVGNCDSQTRPRKVVLIV